MLRIQRQQHFLVPPDEIKKPWTTHVIPNSHAARFVCLSNGKACSVRNRFGATLHCVQDAMAGNMPEALLSGEKLFSLYLSVL